MISSNKVRCPSHRLSCLADSQFSQLTIILSVVGSFVFFVFVIVIAVVVYARFNSGEYRSAESLSSPAPPPHSRKRPDEWEINHDDVMLLEKIGEGLFGVVHKAQLLHRPSSHWKRMRHRTSNKAFVACKMHKGQNAARYPKPSLIPSFYSKGKLQIEDEFLEEINLMKRVGRHQHIVSMVACITRSQPLCLIVEYCCHGDLLNYLARGRHARVCIEVNRNFI